MGFRWDIQALDHSIRPQCPNGPNQRKKVEQWLSKRFWQGIILNSVVVHKGMLSKVTIIICVTPSSIGDNIRNVPTKTELHMRWIAMKCQRIQDFLRCGRKHINVIKFVRPDFKVEDPTGNPMQNKSIKTL